MSSVERQGYPFRISPEEVRVAAESRGAYKGIRGIPEAVRLVRNEPDPALRRAFVGGFLEGYTPGLVQRSQNLKAKLGEYKDSWETRKLK